MLRKLIAVTIIIALCLSVAPLSAQEGLSEEEMALLQRYHDAYLGILELNSYASIFSSTENQSSQVFNHGVQISSEDTTTESQGTNTIIRGDNPSGIQTVTKTTSTSDGMYTTEVELRYVDGIVYAAGRYIEGAGEVVFPSGYAQADPEDPGVFEDYDVDDFVDEVLGRFDATEPFSDPEKMASLVDSVTSHLGELDGVTVDIITMVIPARGLIDATLEADPAAFGDPAQAVIFENITDQSVAIMDIYLDSESHVLGSDVQFLWEIVDFSANQIDPSVPESVTLNITVNTVETGRIVQINEEFPAITAP